MNKVIALAWCWGIVIVATIGLVLLMPAIRGISADAATALEATSNMSNYPGTLEVVKGQPYWAYFIAPIAGIVYTVYILKVKRD
jgi:hypothetical protein